MSQLRGTMKINTFVQAHQRGVIERILRHTGLWPQPSRAAQNEEGSPICYGSQKDEIAAIERCVRDISPQPGTGEDGRWCALLCLAGEAFVESGSIVDFRTFVCESAAPP